MQKNLYEVSAKSLENASISLHLLLLEMIDATILLYSIYGGVLMRSKRISAEKQYRLIAECCQNRLTDHQ